MKKIVFAGTLLTIALILAGCGKNNPQSKPDNNAAGAIPDQKSETNYIINNGELVFFWGAGCSHCENVEKFLKSNAGAEEKLKLKKIEVLSDTNGQKLFLKKVKECNLATAGVPVLYRNGKCTQGDTPIIEELKKNL